ncbi:SRPBCC family protein [Kribbella sp. CA-293567]|uniref:SRPBCC family protein n=1 Tax=Kribbella sp. CA-293567 TaxID=3002436 RepID=UPI0022DE2307|nr:SRPBCC family protein [Kribbella sp. CA-293567]WBQ08296.1 SRPBCC family protein [Kribbella sp. CA-293567]
MSENERLIHASVEDVFAVLTDGWSYASWVVGASRIRDVEPGWPQPGHSIHHSVGAWPLLINDATTVQQYEPLRHLELKVRAWPTGEGMVEFVATDRDGECLLVMRERTLKGPAALIPEAVLDPVLRVRNAETLERLALLAEGRRTTG